MIDIIEEQIKAKNMRRAYSLCTLVKTEGLTPRGVGSKMMVFEDGSIIGSVGGGVIEKQAAKDAVECIRSRRTKLSAYENNKVEFGPACGGVATIFIEPYNCAPKLIVCGAGHVGGALMRLAAALDYDITAIDIRDIEVVSGNIECAAQFIKADSFQEGIESLQDESEKYFLIGTFSHGNDALALAAALKKSPTYIGMMGSAGKINGIFKKLRDEGFSEDEIQSVYAPVGLDIGGETPDEIAISILSEMQMVRYGKRGMPMKDAD